MQPLPSTAHPITCTIPPPHTPAYTLCHAPLPSAVLSPYNLHYPPSTHTTPCTTALPLPHLHTHYAMHHCPPPSYHPTTALSPLHTHYAMHHCPSPPPLNPHLWPTTLPSPPTYYDMHHCPPHTHTPVACTTAPAPWAHQCPPPEGTPRWPPPPHAAGTGAAQHSRHSRA